MRVASFDIGSNTALCLVAERRNGAWVRLADAQEICRVSEGLDQTGVLAEPAIARTEAALQRLVAGLEPWRPERIVATGTAPFRRAANGREVADRLGRTLGVPIDVISGDEEARLGLLSSRAAFPALDTFHVVDIGGASTEIVIARGDGSWDAVSLDVGSVRLTERFVTAHPIADDELARLRDGVERELARAEVGELVAPGAPLVGIAGTVTTLAQAAFAMDAWEPDRVHGARLTRDTVVDLASRLPRLSVAERAAMPGIAAKRADVIAAGAVLLAAIMERVRADDVVVSDRGVRWGRLETLSREGSVG